MQSSDLGEGFEFSSDLLACRRNKLLNPIIPLNPPRLLSTAANQGFSGAPRRERRVPLSLCRLPLLYEICLLTGAECVLYLYVYFTC